MNPAAEQVVARYLDDLGRMLAPAPPAQRAEVLGQVREHVDQAFAELGPQVSEDQARQVLAELGPPADIAAAALPDAAPATPVLARPWLPWLVVGLVALSLVPMIGWFAALAGIVMFLASPLWSRRWKIGGAVAYAALPVLAWLSVWASVGPPGPEGTGSSGGFEPPTASPLVPGSWDVAMTAFLLLPLGWTVVAVLLAVRATRHPAGRGVGPRTAAG